MSWMIGNLAIAGDLILAPLDGYGDPPFRLLCRAYGAALSYVPIVPAEAVLARRRAKRPLVSFYEGERPVGIQFLTRHPEQLARAIERVLTLQPVVIDLNLGCPARKVVASCRGARLLQEPELIGALMAAAVRVSPVPVTAKMRIGWDFFSRNHVEVARILEQNGAAAIAVHGRTRAQAYRGEADWDAIREVREAVSVPVIANGDATDVASIEAILAQTGCPAVMVARGAIGNPWLFGRRDLADVPLAERMRLVARHLHMSVLYYGPTKGVISFRKHVVHYVKGLPGAAAVRTRLMEPTSAEQMLAVLAEHAGLDQVARAALYAEDEREIQAWMGTLCA
jgi:nifR3 family TIM-barrel protein